jgi:hypothetical protein
MEAYRSRLSDTAVSSAADAASRATEEGDGLEVTVLPLVACG